MATIINGSNIITIDNRVFQKDDTTIAISNDRIIFQDYRETLSIPYAEISYPTSTNITALFSTLSGYLEEGSVQTTAISSEVGSGGIIEEVINYSSDKNDTILNSIYFELTKINKQLEKIRA